MKWERNNISKFIGAMMQLRNTNGQNRGSLHKLLKKSETTFELVKFE